MKKKTEKWWDVLISFAIALLFGAFSLHDFYIGEFGNAVLFSYATGFISFFTCFLCYRKYKKLVADIDAEERLRSGGINWPESWGRN